MDTAIDYLDRIKEILRQVKEDYGKLSRQLSQLDLEQQDVLHWVEAESFDAARGYYLAKQLKEIRLKRRIVKNQHELLQMLVSSLEKGGIESAERKLHRKLDQQGSCVYIPRVLRKAT